MSSDEKVAVAIAKFAHTVHETNWRDATSTFVCHIIATSNKNLYDNNDKRESEEKKQNIAAARAWQRHGKNNETKNDKENTAQGKLRKSET
jgi:hypothetical protein